MTLSKINSWLRNWSYALRYAKKFEGITCCIYNKMKIFNDHNMQHYAIFEKCQMGYNSNNEKE